MKLMFTIKQKYTYDLFQCEITCARYGDLIIITIELISVLCHCYTFIGHFVKMLPNKNSTFSKDMLQDKIQGSKLSDVNVTSASGVGVTTLFISLLVGE